MAIKEVLELIGDDVVIKKLQNVQKAGEESLAVFNKPLPDLKFPDIPKVPFDPKPVQEFTGHITKLSDVLKILKPALSEAGVAVGGLGSFGRLANISFAGLAAALTGTVIVKLAELEESAARTKVTLGDLFGSTAAGEAAFKRLEESARSLKTTTQDLLPSVEALTRGLDKFRETQAAGKFVALKREDLPAGLSQGQEAVNTAIENFFKILRAGGLDTAKATEAERQFFETLRSGGQLTADILNKLPTGTVELLAQALGKGALTAEAFIAQVSKAPITIDKVAKGLAGFTAQAQQAFDTKAVVGYKEAFDDLLKTVEDLLKQGTGKGFSEFLKSELEKAKTDLLNFARDAKTIIDTILTGLALVKAPPIPGITTPAAPPADAQRDLVSQFAQASNTIKRENQTTTDSVTADWAAFGSRFDAMTNQIISNSRLWTDSIVDGSKKAANALKAVTAPPPGAVPPGFLTPPAEGVSAFTPPAATQESAQQAATTAQNAIAAFKQADDQIRLIWIDLIAYIQTSFSQMDLSGAATALVQPFQTAVPQIQSIIQQVLQLVQELNQSIQQALQGAGQLSGFSRGGGASGSFAGGGIVRGGGTTTSDSILAWLSNREFVVNAKAVSHYGPEFFAALNAMRVPQNFNMGGMARMMTGNKFAGGGMVRGNPVVLNIDRKSFNMTAGDDTITQLKRFAVASQLSSTGRKPRWVK